MHKTSHHLFLLLVFLFLVFLALLAAQCHGENVYKLLRRSSNGAGLELCNEGLEFLRHIKQPVALVTIVGPALSGKSFTLNQIIGNPKGFAVRDNSAQKTRGVDIWGASVGESNETAVILLDTEGLGASVPSYDRALLLFTILTSSRIIFNFNQNIYTQDFEKL